MNIITFDNILSFLEYNRCILCDTQTDLHECDSCKDLFCIKCDNIYEFNNCSDCYYYILQRRYKNNLRGLG